MNLSVKSNISAGEIVVFWFRRDLRFDDNTALQMALRSDLPVLPIFIFDKNILLKLQDKRDARVQFIYQQIQAIYQKLVSIGSSLHVVYGEPIKVFDELIKNYIIKKVYTNHDYEPYPIKRDAEISKLLGQHGISFKSTKDQVIFEKEEILNGSGSPFRVFTPYMKKWKEQFKKTSISIQPLLLDTSNFIKTSPTYLPSLKELGFEPASINVPSSDLDEELIGKYDQSRDYPALSGTSRLGVHLRFGTISIRRLVSLANATSETFLNELIWREFYMMILYHFPYVENNSFKPVYDKINWLNNEESFGKWCEGKTGYPLVDAGMRQLNQTGFMHNRVRMVVASFLTKHLLIDWRWGEAYFAQKLLDYELASNNGGWQWAAGTGTDAQPYFRIFNPSSQLEKFDKNLEYVKKWLPEFGTNEYASMIVDHKFARERAIRAYELALK